TVQADRDVEERRLAGARWSAHGHPLTWSHGEVDAGQGVNVLVSNPVRLPRVLDLDDSRHATRTPAGEPRFQALRRVMARSASTRMRGLRPGPNPSSAALSARSPDLRQSPCAEPSPSRSKIAFLSHRVRRPTVWPIALAGRNSRAPLSLFTAQVQGREFSAGSPAPTPPGSGRNARLRG